MASETQKPSRGEALSPERRRFMGRLSIALSAVAAAIVGIPVVGFILGPLIAPEQDVWRAVGAVDSFKPGETVSVSFLDPSPMAWAGVSRDDGRVAAAPGVRRLRRFRGQLLASRMPRAMAAEGRTSSCVPAMAAFTMPTATWPPVRRRADCSSIRCACAMDRSKSSPARFRSNSRAGE